MHVFALYALLRAAMELLVQQFLDIAGQLIDALSVLAKAPSGECISGAQSVFICIGAEFVE